MNHFIELGESQNTGNIWVTIHSGSRNLGKKICEYWQNIAYERPLPDINKIILEIKEKFPKKEWQEEIVKAKNKIGSTKKSELDYLKGKDLDGYLSDMYFAQEYASTNRRIIMQTIISVLRETVYEKYFKVKETIETVHNYIDSTDYIIRKGAIRSYIGEKMIIPFNMRDGILICEGKSNSEWNFSAPHGAGRVYSRSKAKEELDLQKFEKDMEGIYSTSVGRGTIDESPDAYKDSNIIEKAIEPTAKILDRIIPIHNMKDVSDEKPWKKKNNKEKEER